MFKLIRENNDYKTLNKRILDVETKLILQDTRISSLEIENKALIDKVLRKIQKRNAPEEEEKEKDIYNGMLLKI